MHTARALGFRSRKAYERARRRELSKALGMVSVPAKNCTQFTFADKETYWNLGPLTEQLATLVGRLQPDLILSPAYEGGHPDHDAAAFAVAFVRQRARSFRHWEFPLYHANRRGRMITGEFISHPRRESVLCFSQEEKSLKSRMLACFKTQQDMVQRFQVDCERFRRAPVYDFTQPPHPGRLLYERWEWGITGADWRLRAAQTPAA